MKIEIDQSGKMEDTSKDTVLAFSNHEHYAILVDRRVKQNIYSKIKKRKILQIRLFVIGIYILLKDQLYNKALIIVDEEYQGNEVLIKGLLLDLIRKDLPNFDHNIIRFERVSKASNAHKLALSIFRKKLKPNKSITEKEIIKLLT